jgi:ferredoxin-NADP reductase
MAHDLHPGWRPARVVDNRPVAKGSMWMTLEAVDDWAAAYEPGHVLSLGLKLDRGFMRHAYTVSRGRFVTRQFEHLYRVISHGRMTPRLSELSPGATVFFHGPFHTPIQHEIQSEAERIVLIATGTGVGPLFGYAEKTLRGGETRPIALYASFREESHICLAGELDSLAHRHGNFRWQYSVTHASESWRGFTGRVTDWVPHEIAQHKLESHHFHLVGNGEMVHSMRRALYTAGVARERVSIEIYFNHHAEPDDAEVNKLANQFVVFR